MGWLHRLVVVLSGEGIKDLVSGFSGSCCCEVSQPKGGDDQREGASWLWQFGWFLSYGSLVQLADSVFDISAFCEFRIVRKDRRACTRGPK